MVPKFEKSISKIRKKHNWLLREDNCIHFHCWNKQNIEGFPSHLVYFSPHVKRKSPGTRELLYLKDSHRHIGCLQLTLHTHIRVWLTFENLSWLSSKIYRVIYQIYPKIITVVRIKIIGGIQWNLKNVHTYDIEMRYWWFQYSKDGLGNTHS